MNTCHHMNNSFILHIKHYYKRAISLLYSTFKGFHVLRENQREILCIVFYLEKKIMLLTFYFYNSFQIHIRGTNVFFFSSN